MDVITAVTKNTTAQIEWTESFEIGSIEFVAWVSPQRGVMNVKRRAINDCAQDSERVGEWEQMGWWITHEVAERAEIELRCSCQDCVEERRLDRLEEMERRAAR